MATPYPASRAGRPLRPNPKRTAVGRYLGSFTMVKGLFSDRQGRSARQTVAPAVLRSGPEDPAITKRRARHQELLRNHGPADPLDETLEDDTLVSKTADTIEDLLKEPAVILYEATTVFPFTLFPDKITIDTQQIKIQHREFFYMKNINAINHEDILNVTAESGPFFATLKITTRFFNAEPLNIYKLWRKDAFKLRSLIHGLMVARHKGVAIDETNKAKLIDMLEKVGEVGQGPIQVKARQEAFKP